MLIFLENFYTQAWIISPDNGHALNQLAILETSSGRHLSALYLYTRSLYVRNPFQLAAGNIEKFCDTIDSVEDSKNYLPSFFRLFSAVHNCRRLDEAENILKTFTQLTVESYEEEGIDWKDLEHSLIIIIGEMWKITSLSDDDASKIFAIAGSRCSRNALEAEDTSTLLASDELRCLRILVDCLRNLTLAAMQLAIRTLADTNILVVVKLAFDFLTLHPEICSVCCAEHEEKTVRFFSTLSSLLNKLQTVEIFGDKKCRQLKDNSPLPEDKRLQGFLPLEKIHATLNFDEKKTAGLTEAACVKTRINRLVSFGKFLSGRFNNSELFSATIAEASGDIQIWTFSAKSPKPTPAVTPSISPVISSDSSGLTAKPSNLVKRQTKCVPLIKIMEREKAAAESEENKAEACVSSKPTSTKTVRIKTPEPIKKNSSPPFVSTSTSAMPDRFDAPPRFQAARLKQALTGEGKLQQQPPIEPNFMPPRWDGQQPPPFGAWGPRPAPFRPIQPPPLMMPPPRPPGADQMDINFHRTPGVRPPGLPPFPPPPPMFSGPPPGFPPIPPPWQTGGSPTTSAQAPWDQRPRGTTAPSLYLGRNEDPYYQVWETQRQRQFGPMDQQMRNVGDDSWPRTEWSWSDGINEQRSNDGRAVSHSPFSDLSARPDRQFGGNNPMPTAPPGFDNAMGQAPIGGERSFQQEPHFSLFGIDSPWETASERLLSQSGKD